MPCYTAWNEHLRPGTPEYLRAEAEVRAKLESISNSPTKAVVGDLTRARLTER